MTNVLAFTVVAGLFVTAAVACGSEPKPEDPTTVYGASSGSAAEGTSGGATVPSGTGSPVPAPAASN